MEDLLSLMQVRTAVPFGYLIFWLAWLSVSFWAAKNVVQQCWTKRYRSARLYVALGLLFLSSLFLYSNIRFDAYLNMNPLFAEADVIGEWQDGDSQFTLLQNGRAILNLNDEYKRRLGLENGEAYWQKHYDFNIRIGSNRKGRGPDTAVLRVISFNGKFRIIVDDYEDPDMWDGNLGFKRENLAN